MSVANYAAYVESKIAGCYAIPLARLIGARAELGEDNETFLSALLGSLVGQVETSENTENYCRVIDGLVEANGLDHHNQLTDEQKADGLRLDSYWQAVAGV